MKKIKGLFLLILFFLGSHLFAQNNDARLWLGFDLSKQVNDYIKVDFSNQYRLNENVTELGILFFEVGARYKLNKNFRLAIHYRFSEKRKITNFYGSRNRYTIDAFYRKKIEFVRLDFRTRFQSQYRDINTSEAGGKPINYWRNKLNFTFKNETRFEPFTSFESFSKINRKDVGGNKFRWKIGTAYELSKKSEIEIFYIIQKNHTKIPNTYFASGLIYAHRF